ncbi:hypothetical protein EMIT0196MI5_230048 [Pseudomonas sp. IT-196MI5]
MAVVQSGGVDLSNMVTVTQVGLILGGGRRFAAYVIPGQVLLTLALWAGMGLF